MSYSMQTQLPIMNSPNSALYKVHLIALRWFMKGVLFATVLNKTVKNPWSLPLLRLDWRWAGQRVALNANRGCLLPSASNLPNASATHHNQLPPRP